MRHILLDVNVVVDLCVERAGSDNSRLAIANAKASRVTLWVYAGSVQTLEYVVAAELFKSAQDNKQPINPNTARSQARTALVKITADYQWLAALAYEGNVFDADDPESEQLICALGRFQADSAIILTRDKLVIDQVKPRAKTPEDFIEYSKHDASTVSLDFIDLKAQQGVIRPQLEHNIQKVLHHGRYIMGPEVGELEERLADFVGVQHCIGVSSGTDALLIAMMALDIGHGDEVITTPFTFIATGEIIALLGAKPVFVDIDSKTYNIDPAKIEAATTPKTKAIMPVSLYGQCADFDTINAIAEKHGLPVIEDGAQSFGATYKGRQSCSLSTIGCASFFPSKPLGGYGDSGACFTNDDNLAKLMKEIRVHGQDRHYHHPRIGINGRMDTLQAAILKSKLDLFPEEVERRQVIGQRYTAHLTEQALDDIIVPWVAPENTSVYAQYTIQVRDREAVQAGLMEQGIPTAVHYPVPLYRQPAFTELELTPSNFPQAEQVSERVVSLPMHPYLAEDEQDKIIEALVNLTGTTAV